MDTLDPSLPSNRGPWRVVSPALFGLALVAFLLPFGAVSCSGPGSLPTDPAPTQITAAQLVSHTVPPLEQPNTIDCRCSDVAAWIESRDAAVATLALLLALGGFVLAVAGFSRGLGWIALVGAICVWRMGDGFVELYAGFFLM